MVLHVMRIQQDSINNIKQVINQLDTQVQINNQQMSQNIQNIIDRYLYPDQVIFGRSFNHNIKSTHQYQMSKSTTTQNQCDELIIYQKVMSNTKIQSMLNMLQGKHPPLFKSSILPKSTHYTKHQDSDGEESFEEQQDDYEDYEEEMYMMEKDYQDNFQDQYDYEENPLIAIGNSLGSLPKAKQYAREYHMPYNLAKPHKGSNAKLFMSQQAPTISQKNMGLGELLASNGMKGSSQPSTKIHSSTSKQNQNKKKPSEENSSDDDWETESESEEGEDHQPNQAN